MKELNWSYRFQPYACIQICVGLPQYQAWINQNVSSEGVMLGETVKSILESRVTIADQSTGRVVYEGSLFDLAMSRLERVSGGGVREEFMQSVNAAHERIAQLISESRTAAIPPYIRKEGSVIRPTTTAPQMCVDCGDTPVIQRGFLTCSSSRFDTCAKSQKGYNDFPENVTSVPEKHAFLKRSGTALCAECGEFKEHVNHAD